METTMTHYWLITEPARGTSIRIEVPDGVDPEDAIEAWADQHMQTRDTLIGWRERCASERDFHDYFSTFYADESGERVELIDETNSWSPR
jgi:hypothetical protein